MALDAYHRWLGIPPKEQPPDHYRLLSIQLFEQSPEVIEAAADRQMGHLRTYQAGEHSALSQKLLNEVAAARVCLLNAEKKAEYDAGLRKQLDARRKVIPTAEPLGAGETTSVALSPFAPRKRRSFAERKATPASTPVQEPEPPLDSGLVRLGETAGGGAGIARVQAARSRRQQRVAAGLGIGAAGLIAVVAVALWAGRSTGPTVLSLRWPEPERRAAALQVDGRRVDLRPSGALEFPLEPGEHRITAMRPGYAPYEEEFALTEGKTLILQPKWRKLAPEPPVPGAKPGGAPGDITPAPKPPPAEIDPKPPDPTPPVTVPKVVDDRPPAGQPLTPEPPKPQRLPLPAQDEQDAARRQLDDVYDLSKGRAPAEKRALAGELLRLAGSSTKPAERFVLLRTALELRCDGGDAAGMLATADRIAAAFATDAAKIKRHYLERFAEGAKDSAKIGALVAAADTMIDAALKEDQYEVAGELADLAYRAAQHTSGRAHRKRAFDRRKQVQELTAAWKQLQAALDKLKTDPDDPDANLAAGRHWCFDRGDWSKGLSHLAKSSDAELKKPAGQELDSPSADASAMVALADAWWELAEKRSGSERDALMLRAGTWYREAQPDVTSTLLKAKVDKRLAEIGKLGRPIPEPLSHGPPPPAVAPFDAKQAKRHQQRWAKHLDVPVETTNSIGMKLVLIPPGEFQIGSTEEEVARLLQQTQAKPSEQHHDRLRSEKPRHRVRITRPFYLGECEVTQAEYERVMGTNPSQFKGDLSCPVERVGWADVQEFLRRLDGLKEEKAAGAAYRLPTEAEWEYACRAGSAGACYWGNDPEQLGQCAWTGRNSKLRSQPVGKKKANAWGLFDMCGNVWELCSDWFAADYYANSPVEDPAGPKSGKEHVLRGGGWWDKSPDFFRSAYRAHCLPNRNWSGAIGFRVVCEIPSRPSGGTSPAPKPTAAEENRPGEAAADKKPYLSPKEVLERFSIPDGQIDGEVITWHDEGKWVMSRQPVGALPVEFGFDIKAPQNHIIRRVYLVSR